MESFNGLLCKECPELVSLALSAAAQHIAEQGARIAEWQRRVQHPQPSPATPSVMVPVYAKADAPKRRRKPGA